MMESGDLPRKMTTEEVVELAHSRGYRINADTVRYAARQGKTGAVKLGRAHWHDRAAVERWLRGEG